MANFKQAFNKVVKVEGGYVNDPDDTGGETYLGISRKHHPNSEMWKIIDEVKLQNAKVSNKRLTELLKQNNNIDIIVETIYKNLYWNKLRLDELTSQSIAEQLFDMAVNSGVSNAIKLAQRVVGDVDNGKFTEELFNKLNDYGNKT